MATTRVSRIGEAMVDEMNAAVASKLAVNPVECMVSWVGVGMREQSEQKKAHCTKTNE